MRTEMRKSERGWLLMGALVVCATWGSANAARPEQNTHGNAPKAITDSRSPTKPEAVKLNKPVVVARNTSPKTGSVASTATTKPQVPEEKKTVGRYWKRLMNMVREVRHAHTDHNK